MVPTALALKEACLADGEFQIATRYWTGGIRIEIGASVTGVTIVNGVTVAKVPDRAENVITLFGPDTAWDKIRQAIPPRFYNDVFIATARGGISWAGDSKIWWQYYAAVQRLVELLRSAPEVTVDSLPASKMHGEIDAPVGRYVHLNLSGTDYRIYYEEAGTGIPLLLQHTAGSHGTQWRHLFEDKELTETFRLIAYDLPFHGKSVPPVGERWWEQEYRLKSGFLRSIPVELSGALGLERPVFMGCSVGGLLALDLAHKHPTVFDAVISLEGALRIGGSYEELQELWHPEVSNETKGRMMEGLAAPSSPEPYRKEIVQTYASGWPPVFLGDLWYYLMEYDLRDLAREIDTKEVGVHIFSGEYDYSGTIEKGKEAHAAIEGSTFTEMQSIGHFPMSENPEKFLAYLKPILREISQSR